MFEIGSTLRDARVRRGISLQQAEDETKIRVKYIQAMENEDFAVLPGGTYVKGFLRTYAEYLDLDYQVVLDEFNDRFGTGEHREHLIQPPRTAKTRTPRKGQNYVFVAIIAVAIIAILAYLGWGNSSGPPASLMNTNGMETTTSTVPTTPAVAAAPAPPPAPATTTGTTPAGAFTSIAFQATKADNWLAVYKDSNMSQEIWAGKLLEGNGKELGPAELGDVKVVWITFGSVDGLVFKVNGQVQKVDYGKTYRVTPTGIKAAGS